jgi:NitT/TauT family transport system substrate-binding protein
LRPQYVCEELLRTEGFTDIRYLDADGVKMPYDLGYGKFDFAASLAKQHIVGIDTGTPIVILSGVHAGCYELFAHEGIHGVADLKGKRIGLTATPELMQMIAAYVGLDPNKDLTLVTDPESKPLELFAEGKLDVYLALPLEPQELHARSIGHVILRTALDRPWSQYFCCAQAGNREFMARYPAATKRVVRAILKAADLCVSEPEHAAQRLVDGGFTTRYDYALQTLSENPYGHWREYDAEDSVRFYALRLHELGMIKSGPKQIIADGTDWRFLDELKRELKRER